MRGALAAGGLGDMRKSDATCGVHVNRTAPAGPPRSRVPPAPAAGWAGAVCPCQWIRVPVWWRAACLGTRGSAAPISAARPGAEARARSADFRRPQGDVLAGGDQRPRPSRGGFKFQRRGPQQAEGAPGRSSRASHKLAMATWPVSAAVAKAAAFKVVRWELAPSSAAGARAP